MPFPENMVKVNFEFDWGTTGEIQDTGFWALVTQDGLAGFQDWAKITDALAKRAVETWVATVPVGLYAGSVIARRAVVYHYSQNHKEVLDRSEFPFDADNAWKGTSTNSLPPENSLVVSLWGYDPGTYVPQRARKRGRMYPPTPTGGALGSDGLVNPLQQGGYADSWKSFFDAFSAELDIPDAPIGDSTHARPHIVSTAGQFTTQVRAIRVGRVVDTQRRRRNKLPEEYLDRDLA